MKIIGIGPGVYMGEGGGSCPQAPVILNGREYGCEEALPPSFLFSQNYKQYKMYYL